MKFKPGAYQDQREVKLTDFDGDTLRVTLYRDGNHIVGLNDEVFAVSPKKLRKLAKAILKELDNEV